MFSSLIRSVAPSVSPDNLELRQQSIRLFILPSRIEIGLLSLAHHLILTSMIGNHHMVVGRPMRLGRAGRLEGRRRKVRVSILDGCLEDRVFGAYLAAVVHDSLSVLKSVSGLIRILVTR